MSARRPRISLRPTFEELEGRTLLSTFTVTTTSDGGAGSFRQAVLSANSSPGTNTIDFAIGSGVQTIQPRSPLPAITNPVVIDGTSQPGFAGTPIIVLDGTYAGAGVNGLVITAGSSTVRGLAIDNFGANGLQLEIGGGNLITGDYIGIDATGNSGHGNGSYGVDVESGQVNTIGGTAAGAGNVISGNHLGGIRVGGGSYWVSEDNNLALVDAWTGTTLATYATGLLNDAVAVGPDGSVYETDYYGNAVLHLDAAGTVLTSFGTSNLSSPQDLIFGPDGNLYVGNVGGGIQEFSPSGTFLRTFVANGSGGLANVKGMTFGPDGNLYVADLTSNQVLRYNATTGAFMNAFVTSGSGGLSWPEDLQFGPDGNLYVTSYSTNSVYRYSGATGGFLGTFATGGNLHSPYGLRFDPAGNLDVASRANGQIQTYNGTTGAFIHNLPANLTNPAWFTSTQGMSGGNVIQGNRIGTNASGTGGVANGFGILVEASNNTIGGTATGTANTIAQNSGKGVVIQTGVSNAIEGNVIYADADPGIDLGNDGITANTGSENLALPNAGVNAPVITLAAINGTTLTVAGYVGTAPGQAPFAGARVEFFAATHGPNNNGQGQTYLGFLNTDANGVFNGMLSVSALNPGNPVTATATDMANNTSEFGTNVALANGPVINLDTDGYGSSYSTTYHADSSPVAVENVTDATIRDPSSPTLVSMTVQIQNGQDGNQEVLTANTAGTSITATYTDKLTLTGTDTLAHYQQVLRSITYQDQALLPKTQNVRRVVFTANDGTHTGAAVTTYVTVSSTALAASITTLSSAPNPSTYGQTITCTANVAAVSLGGTPTGAVTFFDGSATLGTAPVSGGIATFATSTLAAGSHSISAHYSGDATFPVSVSTALTQTVNPAPLTVTTNNASRVYGQPNPAFSVSYAGFVNGDTPASLGGTLQFQTNATTGRAVGSYAVTPSGLTSSNYAITFVAGTLNITPALLTVTADNKSKGYGAAIPPLTDTITGFVVGDGIGLVSGSAALSTTATAGSGVGSYTISAAQGSLSARNYTFAFVSGTITVTPAVLTVTADNKSKVYGDTVPALTDTITGFVGGDGPAVVSGSATLSTTATANSGVGTYAITVTQGSLSAANYTFALVGGTVTVTPAQLTVTADNASRQYGQSDPSFTDTITGFVGNDTSAVVSGQASFSTTATRSSPVGTYSITPSPGNLQAANYTFAFADGTLTVTPAPLTVTADNASKVAGQPNPTFTASYSGFVNGDDPSVLGGTLAFSTPATTLSPVGLYPVTPSGLTSNRYAITLVTGTLNVTAALLSASTASVVSPGGPSVYGQTVTFTASVSAVAPATGTPTGTVTFVDGANDLGTVTLMGGTAVFATANLSAASHAITVRYSGDSSFASTTSGTLTQSVTPAPLTITAANTSKVYGQANPSFTATFSGFVNGDSVGALAGRLAFSTLATASSPVTSYAVVPGGLTSSNYSITYVSGTLSVTPALLTVTADAAARLYGQTNPAFGDIITGFVNGDTGTVVSGSASLSTLASSSSGVGTYPITAARGTLNAANYTFAFTDGTLTVDPAVLTVTANNAAKIYGSPNPALSDTITGFVNGDSASVVSGSAVLATAAPAGSGVGGYMITAAQGSLHAANYTFAFTNGTLTVNPAVLTVTAADASRVYGAANPALTASITGFVDADTAAVVTGSPALTTTATTTSSAGTYTIVVAQGSLAAANYLFTFVNATLTVVPAALTITSGAPSLAATEGQSFAGVVATFTDANPNAVAADFSVSINWGDGQASAGAVVADGHGGFAVHGTHAYRDEGTYPVAVAITAQDGSSASATASAAVADAPLTVTAATIMLTPSSAFAGVVATFRDPGADAVASDDTATIAWGDGQTDTGTITPIGNGAFAVSGSHTYEGTGTGSATITATVADVGGSRAATTVTATAGSAPGLTAVPPAALINVGSTAPAAPSAVLAAGGNPTAASAGSGAQTTAGNASTAAASAVAIAAVAHAGGSHGTVAVDAAVVPSAPAPAPSLPAAPAPAAPAAVPPAAPTLAVAAPAPPPGVSMSSGAPAPALRTDVLWEALDDFQPQIEHRPMSTLLRVGVITSLVASAGYLVFSARASYWLLTLLLARPLVWKRLDPIEVLFAWEREKQRRARQGRDRQGGDDESLQSLVGAKRGAKS